MYGLFKKTAALSMACGLFTGQGALERGPEDARYEAAKTQAFWADRDKDSERCSVAEDQYIAGHLEEAEKLLIAVRIPRACRSYAQDWASVEAALKAAKTAKQNIIYRGRPLVGLSS